MAQKLHKKDALEKLQLVVDRIVSQTVNAYGYVLYIEFGELTTFQDTTPGGKPFNRTHGEYTLVIDGLWKLSENGNLILNSLTADRQEADNYLKKLLHSKVLAVAIDELTNHKV